MGNEVTTTLVGNDHLTAQQFAAWPSAASSEAASLTAEHAALDDHLHTCAACRAQLVMLRQATQLEPELEASPEFDSLLRLGEQAALSAVRGTATPARVVAQPATMSLGWRVWLNWRVAMPVAAMLLLAAGGWWWWTTQAPLRKANEAMQLAWRDRRPLEARISGLPYAPWIQTRDNSESLTDRMAHDRAERILLEELHERPTPVTAHALGRLYLADRKFDQALQQLETALKATPNDAQLLSDLGATHIEKGKAVAQSSEPGQSLVEYAKAYEHLNRAVEQKGVPLEVLFNRAQCLQLMYLPQQAREAWQKYLERDSSSAWADEARRNLQLLEEQPKKTSLTREQLFDNFMAGWGAKDEVAVWQTVSQDRNPLDGGVEDRLLDDYLKAMADGNADKARDSLAALTYLGDLLVQRTGERFTARLATYHSQSDASRRQLSLAGRTAMKSGQREFIQSHYAEAITAYQQAQDLFRQAGNECEALLASFRLGYGYIFQPQRELGEKLFTKLLETAKSGSYLWLEFQSLSALAQINDGRSEYSKVVRDATSSLQLAEKLGDTTATARAFAQLALAEFQLNDSVSSLGWLQRGLELNQKATLDATKRWNLCELTGGALSALRLFQAALAYQGESLKIVEASRHSSLRWRTLAHLGETYAQTGDYPKAMTVVQEVWDSGQKLGSEKNGVEVIARAALQLGHFYRQTKAYPQAIEWYDQSARLYEQLGLQFWQYPAQKGKLLASYSNNDSETVSRTLPVVLQLFEQYREKISSESQRYSFFDEEQSVYDIAIDFEYTKRENSATAFEYAERCRARSLLDRLAADASPPPSENNRLGANGDVLSPTVSLGLTEIQQELPEPVQLLQYAVLKDKVLIWLVTRKRFETRVAQVSSQALTESVQRFRTLVINPAGEQAAAHQAMTELYRLLIEPVNNLLEKDKVVCIVPDKVLHYLPFQALIDPATNEFLLERFKLLYAASANTFIMSTRSARNKSAARAESLLSIGNPTFDSLRYPHLQLLPTAAQEAREVGNFYTFPRILTGSQADEFSVRKAMAAAGVIHLAAHYLIDERSSINSKLLLANKPGNAGTATTDGVLLNAELYRLKFPLTRLVVLSACQTGIEQSLGGEGALNAARPFLAAGVPQVVASLWPVDSTATGKLMIEFHHQRRLAHQPTVEALRQAQISLLRGKEAQQTAPYYWASFSLFGGYAEF